MMEFDFFKQMEIAVLFIVITVGTFSTLSSAVHLWFFKSNTTKHLRNVSRQFILYQKSLNFADGLILLFYATRELIDILQSRQWYGDSSMCKFTHFMGTTGLYLSSNTIVSIGFYRVYCSWMCTERNSANYDRSAAFSTILLASAWIISILLGIPQVFLWDTIEIQTDNSTVKFCTTTWDLDENSTFPSWIHSLNVIHSLSISPIPCLLIFFSYTYVTLVLRAETSKLLTIRLNRAPKSISSASSIKERWQSRPGITGKRESLQKSLDNSAKRKLTKVMRISLQLLFVYVICWLPYNIAILWSLKDSDSFFQFAHFFKFTWHFIALSSVFNSWMYKTSNCYLCQK